MNRHRTAPARLRGTSQKIAPELEEGDVVAGQARFATRSTSTRWTGSTSSSRVHQRFGVEIAESDYAALDTLDRICDYIAARNPQAFLTPGKAAPAPSRYRWTCGAEWPFAPCGGAGEAVATREIVKEEIMGTLRPLSLFDTGSSG